MNRVAKCGDCTVINSDYRLAPEDPAPAGIEDAYAVLKDVIANAKTYGVDPKQIMIFGESGGAYIVAGVSILLAERNESHLIKLQFQQIPMVDQSFTLPNPHPPLNDTEKAALGF